MHGSLHLGKISDIDISVNFADVSFPPFRDRFGTQAPNGDYQIPASWQNGIAGATNVGEIIGLQVCTALVLNNVNNCSKCLS